jgi:hypothetical protein
MKAEDHPAFGMWKDRKDMEDVEACLRNLRRPRYTRDGPLKRRAAMMFDSDVLIWCLRGDPAAGARSQRGIRRRHICRFPYRVAPGLNLTGATENSQRFRP